MDYNQQNGGLLLQTEDALLVTDLKDYSGTYLISNQQSTKVDGLFWFMNLYGNTVYYSDQKRGNALYRMDLVSREAEIMVNKPCYQLTLYGEWLYFVNENDRNLYRCSYKGRDESIVSDEQVDSFFIEAGEIFYSARRGIRRCDLDGRGKETISDAVGSKCLRMGEKLVLADSNKENVLSIIDLKTNSIEVIDDIQVISMNTDGRYLYCANKLNNRSIYRVDLSTGYSIRICGESADYLHVVGDELFFANRGWHKISLLGGQSSNLSLRGVLKS